MKKFYLSSILFGMAMLSISSVSARQSTYYKTLVSSTNVAETTHAQVSTERLDGLSFQVVNTTGVVLSSGTFEDGVKSTGTITINDYTQLHLTASTGSITVVDYTALSLEYATNTVTVVDWSVLYSTPCDITPSTITYGTPSAGAKIYMNDFPDTGSSTFTWTASLPGANEFNDIGDLTLLIDAYSEISASHNGSTVTIVVNSSGTAMQAASITGAGDYSGVSIAFSNGRDNATVTVDGSTLTQGTDWTASVSSGTTGASLSAAINALEVVNSTHNAYGVITTTAASAGAAGNSITLASSDGTNLALGGATYSGGQDAATVTVGTNTLTESTDWTASTSSGTTGISLSDAINALSVVVSTHNGYGVITTTAATAGVAGNLLALGSSDAVNLSTSSSFLTGGQDAATLTIAGTVLTESTDWDSITSNDATATSLAAAVTALAELGASAGAAVVYSTASFPGTDGNYAMVSSSPTYLVLSSSTLLGGVDADVSTTTARIYVATHGWTNGTAVLFETVTGTAPTGLTTGTTYYAIYVDADYVQLASSLANAEAGTAVSITALTGSGSFGLTPLDWDSNAIKLEVSNDGTNWSDLSGYSATLSAAGSTLWNIVDPFFRYIRFTYTPSAGATGLTVTANGKADK